LSAEVCAVELRRDDDLVLVRFARPDGAPRLDDVKLGGDDDTLSWTYRHAAGARPNLVLSVTAAGVTTEALSFDACDHSAALPLARFRRADSLRLSASDGWRVDARTITREIDNPEPVVVRRLGAGRYFADVPPGWLVRWRLGGRTIGDAVAVDV